MLDVHRKIHMWRQHERQSKDEDPIPPVADKLAADAKLLCFDEFQVTDVADAMILKRLFEQMFARGMRFIVTSNRMPNELYKNGLNRPLFVPFIENVLEKEFVIIDLSSGNDYRMVAKKSSKRVFFHPYSDSTVHAEFRKLFETLTHGEKPAPMMLSAFGSRQISVPRSARGVCFWTFDELIRSSFGASDYLALAREFHTIFVDQIPKMERGTTGGECRRSNSSQLFLSRRLQHGAPIYYSHRRAVRATLQGHSLRRDCGKGSLCVDRRQRGEPGQRGDDG